MRRRSGHGHRRRPGCRRYRQALRPGIVAVLASVAAACVGCTSSGSGAAPAATVTATATATATVPAAAAGGGGSLQQEYASTIRRVLPSVVEIRTSSGLGSGVVYEAAGHIVTNAHVVGS